MPASYPGTLRTFQTHVNTTEVIDASHMNDVQNEIMAAQTTIGINPHVSSASTGSSLGAWSAAARTYASLADRLANIEAGHLADTHTQYSRLAANETLAGTKTFTSDAFFGAGTAATSGNIYLSSGTTGGQGALIFREGASQRWGWYRPQGDANFYLRDYVNARQHITYTPGATVAVSNTAFNGGVNIAGDLAVTGGITGGASTLTNLTITGTLTVPAAGAVAPGTSAVGDTPAAGTSTTLARADHRHGREAFGTASSAVALGGASTAGASLSLAHADHVHGLAVGAPVASAPGDTAVTGATGTAADAGHRHAREAAPTATTVGALPIGGGTLTGALTTAGLTVTTAVTTFNDGTLTKTTGAGFALSAALTAPTVTGTGGVYDGAARVYSPANPPPAAAPVVIMPFFVGGSVGTGLRRPEFICTVPMTIRAARSHAFAGSGTYQLFVNGAAISGAAGAWGTAQALYDFADVDLNVGDRVQLNINTASADAVDLSVTADVVTR